MNSSLDSQKLARIRGIVNHEYPAICSNDGAFGQWISGLWGAHPSLDSFDDNKEAFFLLLERLLRDGRVVLTVPGSIVLETTKFRVEEGLAIWAVPIEEQIAHVRRTFPGEATTIHDICITDYLYSDSCPRLGWISDARKLLIAGFNF